VIKRGGFTSKKWKSIVFNFLIKLQSKKKRNYQKNKRKMPVKIHPERKEVR
jgi:hypothetical protein